MVDLWVQRYNTGESLKQIAGKGVDPVSVWNHLRARGTKLRDKVTAQIAAVTKHQKKAFQSDDNERAYLSGFAYGDCQTLKHGRAIRVRTSTTHRALADLFTRLFQPYGYVQRYPSKGRLTGFEWSLQVDLDTSFGFLLRNLDDIFKEYSSSVATFLSFLSGFFDAEGSIYLHQKGSSDAFELSISNTNTPLLQRIQEQLTLLGHHSKLETVQQQANRLGYHKVGSIPKLRIWRIQDVLNVVGTLSLRHRERLEKAKLVLDASRPDAPHRSQILRSWEALISQIKEETDTFVDEARTAYPSTSHIQRVRADMGQSM